LPLNKATSTAFGGPLAPKKTWGLAAAGESFLAIIARCAPIYITPFIALTRVACLKAES
jgi:hypothetical protein